jgi:hypothetical protein
MTQRKQSKAERTATRRAAATWRKDTVIQAIHLTLRDYAVGFVDLHTNKPMTDLQYEAVVREAARRAKDATAGVELPWLTEEDLREGEAAEAADRKWISSLTESDK